MASKDLYTDAANGENDTLARVLGEYQRDGSLGATNSGSDSEDVQDPGISVIFDKHLGSRRRASLAPGGGSASQRPTSGRQKTSCFVHQLLEEKSKNGQWTPSEESLAQAKPADKDSPILQNGSGDDGTATPKPTQSRLLTKKQLSDMAFGIRELSKKLGHLRMLLKVRNVFLLTKAHDQKLIKNTRDVTEWLLKQKNSEGQDYIVWVEETMRESASFDAKGLIAENPDSYTGRLKYWTNELCRRKPHTFEICLALGGDGTVLYASWLFQRVVPPVMSFALGSLGFLTKFDFATYPSILTQAFAQGITVSLRLRFEATIMRSRPHSNPESQSSRDLIDELIGDSASDPSTHSPGPSHNILNDIVLDRGPNATMSSIEVFGDEDHFTTVQADGICVATPTGSTAYNLAAGGSLCHPDNPVILVTAIAPHTLSFRPIILPDTIVLRIGVPYDARASCWASFDGKERSELKPGDYCTISASRFPFPSVLPLNRRSEDWVESISRTLNWNNRQRQKAFDREEGK